jgi:hypothetical protein
MAFDRSSARRCALATGAALYLFALTIARTASAESLTDRVLNDCRDGRLDDIEFSTAALIASGVEDECELAGWITAFAERRDAVVGNVSEGPAIERLRAIHAAMHRTILTGSYRTAATDLRLALAQGDFNCLSSLAIYFDLCQAAGLDLEIWLGRGHVYLRGAQSRDLDSIEPEASLWQEPRFARQSRGRRITPVELLGKFYYNRGVQMLRDRQFAEGLELLKFSLALDTTDSNARANLAAGYNNWAAERCAKGQFGDAAYLIQQGLEIDPGFAPLIANEHLVRAKLSD